MRRRTVADELITNGALLGAVVLTLVRPRHVARIAASPLVEKTINSISVRPASPPPGASQRKAKLAARYSSRRELTRITSQQLNDGTAMLALSVLADSAVEHYRGSFLNKAMYAPLAVAALTIGGSLFGRFDPRGRKHVARDIIYGLAAATGLVGLGFHAFNIVKRPGGLSWLNLFYSAPIGAPMALTLAGLLGRSAERIRDTRPSSEPTLLGLPAGRTLAGTAATGLAGTVAEVGLLHFRGAYHNPAMILPVTVPSIASILLGITALRPGVAICRLTRLSLWLTAAIGLGGVGFHAYGIARNMGGWRNWSQNILNGPPLPAPPSFTGLALAGLAALTLIEKAEPDA